MKNEEHYARNRDGVKTHNSMTESDWLAAAVRFCSGGTLNHHVFKIGTIAFERRCCLIHASHLLMIAEAPRCELCDGVNSGEKRSGWSPIHELCRLRRRGGRPTPRLPDPKCTCARCQ